MGYKNPRRVLAGKVAYAKRKAAQDERDKKAMQIISSIIAVILMIGMAIHVLTK